MYMIMLVLDNPNYLDQVLKAWQDAGIRGATIVESTGIHRVQRLKVPMAYLYQSTGLFEEGHLTLFVIVETEQLVKDCLEATERIVGHLDEPDTGVFAAWQLTFVRGVPSLSEEA